MTLLCGIGILKRRFFAPLFYNSKINTDTRRRPSPPRGVGRATWAIRRRPSPPRGVGRATWAIIQWQHHTDIPHGLSQNNYLCMLPSDLHASCYNHGGFFQYISLITFFNSIDPIRFTGLC